jgi:hypothetical protein
MNPRAAAGLTAFTAYTGLCGQGDITIAPPPSIVDSDGTVRSRFIGHAARHRMGANALARDTAGGVGGIVRGIRDEEIALTPGNFFPVPCRYRSGGTVRSSPPFSDRCALLTLRPATAKIGVPLALLYWRALRTTRGRCVAG